MSESNNKSEPQKPADIPYRLPAKAPEYDYQPLDDIDKIDAVYAFVDMNDPAWAARYESYTGQKPPPRRFKAHNELEYSIKSLRKFCPFIDKIYILVDEQTIDWLDPTDTQMIIIDRKHILGEECLYPTFNIISVESYLHNIPGLSECFMYLNDDFFIGNHLTKEMWFQDSLPVVDVKGSQWDYAKTDADFFLNNKFQSHLYHANRLYNQRFGVMPNYGITHQAQLLRKSCHEEMWRLYCPELKEMVSASRVRTGKEAEVTLLSQFVGVATGRMLIRRLQDSPLKTMLFNMENQALVDRCLSIRPHLFCLNDVTDETEETFKSFIERYLDTDP